MNTITMKDGTTIYYKDWGRGPVVTFSHGWPLSSDAWDGQMLFLAQHGLRVVAHDRRGHGRSSQPSTGNDMDGYADDLAAVIEALDLRDITMVGHSTGGGEVARYIGRHGTKRVSKAVLISAVPPTWIAVTTITLLAATTAPGAGEQEKHNRGVANVVLVHGAWADGTSWSRVIPLLETRGLQVVAVQLPLTSLADDVATVQRAIALVDGPLLLVAHSYGGVVITQAGNDPKVAGLLYVAAFAPMEGQSAFDLATAIPPPSLRNSDRIHSGS